MMTFNTLLAPSGSGQVVLWTGVAPAIIRHFSVNFKTPNTMVIIATYHGLEDNENVKQSSE
jgi:hypothetical protein